MSFTGLATSIGASIGGSLNGAQGTSISSGYSSSQNLSNTDSYARTYGNLASQMGAEQAEKANQSALQAWQKASEYNAKQAEIQRAWQEKMSNTQYQRAMEDMRKAGLNPILAYSQGISGASVGSGATASMTSPSTYMGQTFAEQNSASHSSSSGSSNGTSYGWSQSESGLATGLEQIGTAINGLITQMASSKTVNNILEHSTGSVKKGIENLKDKVEKAFNNKKNNSSGGGHAF